VEDLEGLIDKLSWKTKSKNNKKSKMKSSRDSDDESWGDSGHFSESSYSNQKKRAVNDNYYPGEENSRRGHYIKVSPEVRTQLFHIMQQQVFFNIISYMLGPNLV